MSFTTCKHCGKTWPDREAFVADAGISISGCQVDTRHPAESALLFDHRSADCGTTMALPLRRFQDLCTGPRHKVSWAKSKMCPGMCSDPRDTAPCAKECSCAYVRAVLQEVMKVAGSA